LAEALRKRANFIWATEIYAEATDSPLKAKTQEDRNLTWGEKRQRGEAQDTRFTSDRRSILMEIKGHPMLKKLQLITDSKPYNARK